MSVEPYDAAIRVVPPSSGGQPDDLRSLLKRAGLRRRRNYPQISIFHGRFLFGVDIIYTLLVRKAAGRFGVASLGESVKR